MGSELVVSSDHRSVGEDVRCVRRSFVDGRDVNVWKSSACVSAECLGELACVVVVVEGAVSFCFGDSWPISFKEGRGEDAVFDDGEWFHAPGFVLSPERESGIC